MDNYVISKLNVNDVRRLGFRVVVKDKITLLRYLEATRPK